MQNISYEDAIDLHEKEHFAVHIFHINGLARRLGFSQAKGNSGMAH